MEEDKKLLVISATALLVIIISIGSLLDLGATGRVTDNGTVNVTVQAVISINYTIDDINFGAGAVTTAGSAVLYSENATVINGNWTSPSRNFTLENIGNGNVSIHLGANRSAADFIGGTSPAYEYKVWDEEAGSCKNTTTFNLGERYAVNTTAAGTLICNQLQFYNDRDSINISIILTVPSDAANGAKGDYITAIATAV